MTNLFFDIDGCLVDYRFKLNTPLKKFVNLVSLAKRKGIKFHVNSNRSRESILKIYKQLGFDGLIICENGAEVYDPNKGTTDYISKSLDKDKLSKILEDSESTAKFVDTDLLVKSPKHLIKVFKKKKIVYFCERTRKFTMTIHPRLLKEKKLLYNESLLFNAKKKLDKYSIGYKTSIDSVYGNVIMIPVGVNKGLKMKRIAGLDTIASFGDGESDFPMFEVSDICGAPANASENVKSRVTHLNGFVSKKEFTKGAYEFLEKILKGVD